MCRIAGLINALLPDTVLTDYVRGMCDIQQHGGPDDEGVFLHHDAHLSFGHRRLSLIDLTPSGHQPMTYNAGKLVITYNGEIYNYIQLKSELEKAGCHFTSQSDTEVILAAFSKWGTASFDKFNGIFAFALFDQLNDKVYLVRDGMGVKPLYYSLTNEGLAFSSEVRALSTIPYLSEKNEYWQVYLMAYGHLPEPVTTLRNVQPIEKGTYLTYHISSGQVKFTPFAHYSYTEKIIDRNEAIHLIQSHLRDSIQRQLVADAPVGVFLSGGLDSSIIALLADHVHSNLNTISIFFNDNKYSEKKYQDILYSKLSCVRHQHLIREEDFNNFLPSIIHSMDLPSCDGINTWFISKYAKECGLKAVLSGVGGDELLGGYPSFNRIRSVVNLQKLPNTILRASRYSNTKKIRRLCYLSIPGSVGKYLFLRGQFIPSEIAGYLNMDEGEVWRILEAQPHLNNIDFLTPKNQASWLETNLYMQNQLLRDSDVMSMAHGVEIRVPFLDKEFVKMVLNISSAQKYTGEYGKQLLIDSFSDILPEQIWNRPKMGFTFPFKEWLCNERYNKTLQGKDVSEYRKKMQSQQMHWSMFFTLHLLDK